MKKFYVTLVAFAIMASSFAQEAVLPAMQVRKENQTFIPKANKTLLNQSKGISGSYWFSYPDFLTTILSAWEEDVDDYGNPILVSTLDYNRVAIASDSTVRAIYFDGSNYDTMPVQFFGAGQVFAFNSTFWDDGARLTTSFFPNQPAPHMNTATTYSVDSVGIEFTYWRGTEVAPSVVDTLFINVLSNLTEKTSATSPGNLIYSGLVSGGQNWIKYADIPYNINTLSVTEPTDAHLEVIPVLLTPADTTLPDGSNLLRYYPVTGMTNLEGKSLLVYYTFKPGVPSNPQNIMSKEVSIFRGFVYDDPRPEYVGYTIQTLGNPPAPTAVYEYHQELWDERNTSLCVMDYYYSFDLFANKLTPMSMWAGPVMRPSIYALITCDNCSWTGIKEIAKKNVTISPNPATSNFTVDLGAAGKSNVEMFNLVGQKVYSNSTNDASITVNVSDFKSGVYMLKINQNGQVYTSKVVVK